MQHYPESPEQTATLPPGHPGCRNTCPRLPGILPPGLPTTQGTLCTLTPTGVPSKLAPWLGLQRSAPLFHQIIDVGAVGDMWGPQIPASALPLLLCRTCWAGGSAVQCSLVMGIRESVDDDAGPSPRAAKSKTYRRLFLKTNHCPVSQITSATVIAPPGAMGAVTLEWHTSGR